MGDVAVSPRRGRLRVALGKGDAYREVPLNRSCRSALDDWTAARGTQLEALAEKDPELAATDALWLARGGGRLGSRAIDLVLRRLAADAGVELSAHVLRHTCVTDLIRSGADVVLVAELAATAASTPPAATACPRRPTGTPRSRPFWSRSDRRRGELIRVASFQVGATLQELPDHPQLLQGPAELASGRRRSLATLARIGDTDRRAGLKWATASPQLSGAPNPVG